MKDNFSLNNKAANFKPGYVEKAVLVGVAANWKRSENMQKPTA